MRAILPFVLMSAASPASAEVISANPHGFEISISVSADIPVAQAYAAFSGPGAWWSDGHTYSGQAANMRLTLQPGGCFCESIPGGGGVEHMRVSVVQPSQRIVMAGALGPLLYEAVAGVMDVRFEPAPGGSRVILNYRAAGFAKGNADKLAPLVDSVLAEQMRRFAVYAGK